MVLSVVSICCGACLGAISRWIFNLLLNPLFGLLPMGTLAVNLLGSFIMGMMMAIFTMFPLANPQWKLFIITGFLGSFTTFSAFAGEMGNIIMSGKYLLCAGAICLHVFGSILMVFLGIALISALR